MEEQEDGPATERELRFALKAGRVGTWALDLSTQTLTTSEACRVNFGRDTSQPFTYTQLRDAVHPDDQARMRQAVEECIRTGIDYDIEYRLLTPAGEIRWARIRAQPSYQADGTPRALFGISIDTTAWRRAEHELRELKDSLEEQVAARTGERNELWDLSRDVMLRCSFDGEILTVNPAWSEMLGHREEDLLGTKLFALLHPDDLERTKRMARAHAGGASFLNFENRCRHVDGSYRWISWSSRSAGGVILAVGRDVTAEKAAAESLARIEDALRQSQKMEAVGQLTGGLAHDFNNLLSSISGALEFIQIQLSEGRPQDADKYLTVARGATKRAAALTRRLLAFSRHQSLLPRVTDVNVLVNGMLDLIRQTIGPDIALDVEPAERLWPALVDPSEFENSLLNLCINARDAMPAGGRLTIETHNHCIDRDAGVPVTLPAGDYLALCVRDTGTGMTAEVAAKAFEPFFTTKRVGEGSGLGLSMVFGFAKQSGGQVRIQSEPARGTSVFIYLPRYAAVSTGAG